MHWLVSVIVVLYCFMLMTEQTYAMSSTLPRTGSSSGFKRPIPVNSLLNSDIKNTDESNSENFVATKKDEGIRLPSPLQLQELRKLAKVDENSVSKKNLKSFYLRSGGYHTEEVRNNTYIYLLSHLKSRHKMKKEKRLSQGNLDTFGLL